MNKRIFFLLGLFSIFIQANNDIIIQGKFIENTNEDINFLKLEQFKIGSKIIATSNVENQCFKFVIPNNVQPGVYRLKFSQNNPNHFIDIIINGKEKLIELNYNCQLPNALPKFNLESENYIYYSFIEQRTRLIETMSVSQFFLQNYPNTKDVIYKKVLKNYYKEIKKIKQIEKNYLQINQKYFWATLLIKNKSMYFPNNLKLDNRLIEEDRYKNYWKFIDISNSKILNTPIYCDHILYYLQYYLNPNNNFTNEEIEQGLKESVDKIIFHLSLNEETKKFAILYLIKGFQEIGFESIVEYIDTKYHDLILKYSNENEIENFLSRINSYNKLKPGNLAPNIEWKEENKEKKSGLYQIKAKEIVLVFWSSECPHCIENLKKIDSWASENIGKVVIAIGIETNKEMYYNTIKNYKNLMHYSDFNGFNSKVVNDYEINATPTFYIIDENKLIIKKYDYYPF